MMEVAYIAGAYRSNSINGIHDNIQYARKKALQYWKRGYAVICPHMNTAFMDGACKDEVWLKGDIEILKRCDVLILIGWTEGSTKEHDIAKERGMEIIYDIS